MAKPVDCKSNGFAESIKVFFKTAPAGAIVRNSVFFHNTIITNNRIGVNRLFEQDHRHYNCLCYKPKTNGNNV